MPLNEAHQTVRATAGKMPALPTGWKPVLRARCIGSRALSGWAAQWSNAYATMFTLISIELRISLPPQQQHPVELCVSFNPCRE